jgi:ceramide glucosyltransferase
MTAVQELIGSGLALLSFVATGFTIAAALVLARISRLTSVDRDPPRGEPVTLLKPLYLAEPGLEENLRSFFQQDYGAPVQIVFGAMSQGDPALNIVDSLRREFPQADVHTVVEPMLVATNPKMANLINMVAHAKHELLIMSDSDIRVPPDYLRRVADSMEEPGVGAVSLLYSGRPAGNLWSKLAAMNIDCHFLPHARLGIALGLARPCFGSTIAFRRKTLAEIGGFERLSNVLADDYELGRAIRRRGYRVAVPDSIIVEHVCSQKSASQLLHQELRWAKTNFVLTRMGHAGSVVTYPLPLALFAAAFLGFAPVAVAALSGALASRLFLVFNSRRRLGHGKGYYAWLLPLRDVLSFFVYVASFFGRTVEWRGRRFATRADGALARV